jgi:uncharacterized protein HemX
MAQTNWRKIQDDAILQTIEHEERATREPEIVRLEDTITTQAEEIRTLACALMKANAQLLESQEKENQYQQTFLWFLEEMDHLGTCQHVTSTW